MSNICIKNWERFQHYKDRDPPWIKLYRDILTSESWVLGTDLSRLVQVASTMLAPRYSNKIPYRFDLLKKVMSLDCNEQAFKKAVEHLIATGFLEIEALTSDAKVVEQSASTTLATCTSETETDQRQIRDRSELADKPPIEFEDLQKIYPKRAGDSGWGKRALGACRARLSEGSTWEDLRAGVERYARFCEHTGKIGTEFVKQAQFFFGPEKHFLKPWDLPATKADARQSANLDAAREFLNVRN